MLTLFIISFLAEAILYFVPAIWKRRRFVALVIFVIIAVSTIGLFGIIGVLAGLLFGILAAYRLGNLLRILKGRMHDNYLRQVTKRTSLQLFILYSLTAVLALGFGSAERSVWTLVNLLQVLTAAAILVVTNKNIAKLRFHMPNIFLTDRELPTVSVAIPARNETADLEACLQSILANDYPKLEVLVLDDCSQDKTAEIIRSFAHDGVRFINGEEPQERWLAKNQAYQKLYEAASGDLVLFCGVDVRFGPGAIRSMVNLMAARQKSMLSVLPTRGSSSWKSVFIQPMRYWWELALPRRIFNKPPVLSTCWLIGRSDLRALGGFAAVSHTILPERYFAREMIASDQYSFVRSSAELRVQTVKSVHEQYETALRTKYPQLRRRPENTLIWTILIALFMLGPFVGLVTGFAQERSTILPLFACILLVATHVTIVRATDPRNTWLALLTFPIAVLLDTYLNYISMLRYEFFTVEWKDRNICIPVMHVIPKLPDLHD